MKYIVFTGSLNIRKGGPSGYLANLKQGIDCIEKNEVEFLCNKANDADKGNFKSDIKKTIMEKLNKLGEYYLEKVHFIKLFKYSKKNIENLLVNYKDSKDNIVHFHMAIDFYNGYNEVKKSKKILTTHNPECFSTEYINGINAINNKNYEFNKLKKSLKDAQIFAYKNADYLIFPSKEALEPYHKTIDGFSEIIKNKKIFYNMTGCRKLDYNMSEAEFRKKYKLEDKFVIAYVGRKNEIKGYDIFLNLVDKMRFINKDIVFITAGVGPIQTPKYENLIDIGWTNDPGSVINSCDLFILPNRMTYFDLILLEVMSIGKPVLASDTGGNITIANITNGVELFKSEDIEDIIKKIINICNDDNSLEKMGKANLDAYNEYFTIEKFAERYLEILEKIKFNN